MYAAERQQDIAVQATTQGRVAVSALAERYGVTSETIRRDLDVLARTGTIRRVHGGAVPAASLNLLEVDVVSRYATNAVQKEAIARAALRLIPDHASIVLDAGTTTARLAELFTGESGLTVITHSVQLAARLAGVAGLEVHVLGGRVRTTTGATVGSATVSALAQINPDLAFVGVNGLSMERGLTTPDPDEAAVKAAITECARRVVVLADSTKLERSTLITFASLSQVHALVTDDGISPQLRRQLEDQEIEVVIG